MTCAVPLITDTYAVPAMNLVLTYGTSYLSIRYFIACSENMVINREGLGALL